MGTSARRSLAIPRVPPLISKHAAEQPHFPRREDDRAFDKSYSLFTSIVRSKMSNLPHHNNSLPPPYRSAGITCSHNAADEMFRLPDSGMPPITSAQPGGRLFTSRQNDVLQIRPSTTLCFCLFCRRLRPLKKKSPPPVRFTRTKGAAGHRTLSHSTQTRFAC